MIIVEFNIYEFDLRLKRILDLKTHSLSSRKGIIIKLTCDNGYIGHGEISPLPGFSNETYEEAFDQILSLKKKLSLKPLSDDIPMLTENLFPSVKFGFETALLNVMPSLKTPAFSSMINVKSAKEVPVNALLFGNDDNIYNMCQEKLKSGYKSFKVKIKKFEDIKIIKSIRELIGEECNLRVDANKAFDFDTAVDFINKLEGFDIEYIEEPFADSKDLFKYLESNTDTQVAMDETIREITINEFIGYESLKAVILKPTMLGFMNSMNIARAAVEKQIQPVISSSFESSYGISVLAMMAAIINSNKKDIAAGLDTLDWFEENLFDANNCITNGSIIIDDIAFFNKQIYFEKLREVSVEAS